jgi:hypothetical protein
MVLTEVERLRVENFNQKQSLNAIGAEAGYEAFIRGLQEESVERRRLARAVAALEAVANGHNIDNGCACVICGNLARQTLKEIGE